MYSTSRITSGGPVTNRALARTSVMIRMDCPPSVWFSPVAFIIPRPNVDNPLVKLPNRPSLLPTAGEVVTGALWKETFQHLSSFGRIGRSQIENRPLRTLRNRTDQRADHVFDPIKVLLVRTGNNQFISQDGDADRLVGFRRIGFGLCRFGRRLLGLGRSSTIPFSLLGRIFVGIRIVLECWFIGFNAWSVGLSFSPVRGVLVDRFLDFDLAGLKDRHSSWNDLGRSTGAALGNGDRPVYGFRVVRTNTRSQLSTDRDRVLCFDFCFGWQAAQRLSRLEFGCSWFDFRQYGGAGTRRSRMGLGWYWGRNDDSNWSATLSIPCPRSTRPRISLGCKSTEIQLPDVTTILVGDPVSELIHTAAGRNFSQIPPSNALI